MFRAYLLLLSNYNIVDASLFLISIGIRKSRLRSLIQIIFTQYSIVHFVALSSSLPRKIVK